MLSRLTNRIRMSITDLTSTLSALTTESATTPTESVFPGSTTSVAAAADLVVKEEETKKHPGTAPKATKRRKSQSQEAFDAQRAEYLERGPVVQTSTSLLERDYSGASAKIDRQALRNAVERAYFIRDYAQALAILRTGFNNNENADTENERGGAAVGERERKELETLEHHILKAQAAAATATDSVSETK
ncbi:hypothetical protein D0Z03_000657 [Geotrichum reessii]|nr:hypothetical protein D0Z03_000657 [Galactomyces reessii]